jgi:hypothetical protein
MTHAARYGGPRHVSPPPHPSAVDVSDRLADGQHDRHRRISLTTVAADAPPGGHSGVPHGPQRIIVSAAAPFTEPADSMAPADQ